MTRVIRLWRGRARFRESAGETPAPPTKQRVGRRGLQWPPWDLNPHALAGGGF